MDDRFLSEMRRDPDPRFARDLRERLRAAESRRRVSMLRWSPALAGGLAAALVVALFAFPAVRVSAQSMLDLFRVRKFAAVQFDESRLDKLKEFEKDNAMMVFDRKETVVDPGPAVVYPSLEAAGAAAGLAVRRPTLLPRGLAADTVRVEGAGQARLSVSEDKLRALLEALDLRDVTPPAGIDDQVLEVRKPPVIIQKFTAGNWRAALVQSKSPELSVPAGFDIERLAEIGLRVLGLDAGEARRVAQNTDWRSTLVVPVPMRASTFRQVTVHGQQGLMITTTHETDSNRRGGTVVLWTENEHVYGLMGNLPGDEMLAMAESVQ